MNEKLWKIHTIVMKSLGPHLDHWSLAKSLVFVYLLGIKHALDVLGKEEQGDE